jgi:hypothetical protein
MTSVAMTTTTAKPVATATGNAHTRTKTNTEWRSPALRHSQLVRYAEVGVR